MSPVLYALLFYLGWFILVFGVAGFALASFVNADARRQRRRGGALPDEAFRSIVEFNYPEHRRAQR